jgi:hypothetical protein
MTPEMNRVLAIYPRWCEGGAESSETCLKSEESQQDCKLHTLRNPHMTLWLLSVQKNRPCSVLLCRMVALHRALLCAPMLTSPCKDNKRRVYAASQAGWPITAIYSLDRSPPKLTPSPQGRLGACKRANVLEACFNITVAKAVVNGVLKIVP